MTRRVLPQTRSPPRSPPRPIPLFSAVPRNRLSRSAGAAPCKGVGEATRSARSLGVYSIRPAQALTVVQQLIDFGGLVKERIGAHCLRARTHVGCSVIA